MWTNTLTLSKTFGKHKRIKRGNPEKGYFGFISRNYIGRVF